MVKLTSVAGSSCVSGKDAAENRETYAPGYPLIAILLLILRFLHLSLPHAAECVVPESAKIVQAGREADRAASLSASAKT